MVGVRSGLAVPRQGEAGQPGMALEWKGHPGLCGAPVPQGRHQAVTLAQLCLEARFGGGGQGSCRRERESPCLPSEGDKPTLKATPGSEGLIPPPAFWLWGSGRGFQRRPEEAEGASHSPLNPPPRVHQDFLLALSMLQQVPLRGASQRGRPRKASPFPGAAAGLFGFLVPAAPCLAL